MKGVPIRFLTQAVMAGAALFLIAPLIVIAAVSLSPSPVFDLPTGGASLRWYGAVTSLDVSFQEVVHSV
jgi:putative spermidine/putrescine transport system permease protein